MPLKLSHLKKKKWKRQRFSLEERAQKQMNVPFEYKQVHLQNMHVASIRGKKAFSWFTDNLLWHTLTTILFLFEKLVWIPEDSDSKQFIFMSFAKFQWSWTFRAKHLCDNLFLSPKSSTFFAIQRTVSQAFPVTQHVMLEKQFSITQTLLRHNPLWKKYLCIFCW